MSDESKSESKNDRHAYVQKTGPRGGPTLEQGTSGELDECALCGGSELAVQHSAQEEFDEALRRTSGKGAPSQTAPLGCLACGAGDGEYHRQGCSRLRELDEAVRVLSTPPESAGVSVGSPGPEVPTPPAPTGEPGDPAQGSTAQADWRDTRPTNIGDSRMLDDLVSRPRKQPIILGPAPSGTFDVGPRANTRAIEALEGIAKTLVDRVTTLERRAALLEAEEVDELTKRVATLEAQAEAVGAGLSRCEGAVAAMTTTHADRIETIEDEVRSLKQAVLELRELNSAQAFGARHAASREKLGELFDEANPKCDESDESNDGALAADPLDVYVPRAGDVIAAWNESDHAALAGWRRVVINDKEYLPAYDSPPWPHTETPTMRPLLISALAQPVRFVRFATHAERVAVGLAVGQAPKAEPKVVAADAVLELMTDDSLAAKRPTSPAREGTKKRELRLGDVVRVWDADWIVTAVNVDGTLDGTSVETLGKAKSMRSWFMDVPAGECRYVRESTREERVEAGVRVERVPAGETAGEDGDPRWRQIALAYASEIAQRPDLVATGFCQGSVFDAAREVAGVGTAWGGKRRADVCCPSCGSERPEERRMCGNINDRYPCRDTWHGAEKKEPARPEWPSQPEPRVTPAKPGSRTVRLLADVVTPDGVMRRGTVAWVSNWDATTGRAIVISTRGGEVTLDDDQWEAMP